MAKKRLNMGHRNMLKDLAYSKISSRKTENAYIKARKHVEELVLKEYNKALPEEDTAILKKYKLAKEGKVLNLLFHDSETGDSRYDSIKLTEAVAQPSPYNWRIICKYNGPIHKALQNMRKTKQEHDEVIASLKSDYATIISSSKTFEELVELWPEAEELRSAICGVGSALTVVNTEVINRVRKDYELRQKGVNNGHMDSKKAS